MGNFWKAIKSAAKATVGALGPGSYRVEEKEVICSHCGNSEFTEGTAQLNTAGMTFIGLDWANKSAHTLLCANCGHIEWFMQNNAEHGPNGLVRSKIDGHHCIGHGAGTWDLEVGDFS